MLFSNYYPVGKQRTLCLQFHLIYQNSARSFFYLDPMGWDAMIGERRLHTTIGEKPPRTDTLRLLSVKLCRDLDQSVLL